jgi:hypothetical protein
MDDIAALVAAKTVINLLGWRDAERGRIFPVKGTQAKKVAAAALVQPDILLDNTDEFTSGFDILDHLFWYSVDERLDLSLFCRQPEVLPNHDRTCVWNVQLSLFHYSLSIGKILLSRIDLSDIV